MEIIGKEMFEIMVADWLADHSKEMDNLKIGNAYQNEGGEWVADAYDEKCTYILVAVDGDIDIRYVGAKR